MNLNHAPQLIARWQAAEQRPFVGFDFSYFDDKCVEDQPPWSYDALVRELMPQAQAVLDIGTGGGEKLLSFRDVWPPQVTVTEEYPPHVQLIHERLAPLGVTIIEHGATLDGIMPLTDAAFGLVIDRHAAFNAAEVERVLKPGGIFLTQQVDGRNLSDLSDCFETTQPWTDFTLEFALAQIKATPLQITRAEDWTGQTTFQDVETIVYFLRAVPWIVPGFSVETHQAHLFKLQAQHKAGQSLTFTQKRMLIQTRKVNP